MSLKDHLPKKLGLISMILLCLNGIVGSGLFLLPGQVAALVGNWGLFLYVGVALVVMAIAWCFVKCASRYSCNGGAYLYAKEAFGSFIGFEIGIMRWVVGMIAWGSLAVGFVTALGSICPIVLLAPFKQLIIIGLIGGLGLINSFGLSTMKRLNNVITVAKLLPLLAFLVLGIFYIDPSHFSLISSPALHIGSFGSAALIMFYAFSGFESLPVAAADMKEPKKNIPIAIMTAIALSSCLYFLVQFICVGTLGSHLASSASPIADVAQLLYGHVGKLFVSIAMLVSIGGITIASSFFTPRSCSALAEDGMLSPKLFKQNRFGSPHVAILISVLITTAIALSGNFVQLVTISVVSRFAQHITTCLALYVFEKRGVMNPFDKPWKKAIPVIALTGILWLLFHAELYQVLWGFGALVLGVPLYFFQKWTLKKPEKEIEVLPTPIMNEKIDEAI
jgi:amino acid transporter